MIGKLKRAGALVLALAAALLAPAVQASAASRIKDVVSFEGVRVNQLIGYGLVVGLNGTGDSLRNNPQTQQSMQSMLERLGVNTRNAANMDTKDTAAVIVTANLPAFAAAGSQIDVNVSAMGDAKSLLGGTLLVTSMIGADNEVYAVAQGTVETGAVSATGASGSSFARGVPTQGRVASGATVERETGFQLSSLGVLRLTLHNPDFTTAQRIAAAINTRFPGAAAAENPSIVSLTALKGQNLVNVATAVEQLEVDPDTPARVVINEADGVVVMGADVRISTVAIAQGNLTISVQETPQVSQPQPFSGGQTTVVANSQVGFKEQKGRHLVLLKEGASLSTLVKGLNALGVSPRDMISILQAIKASGALQADIQVM